MHWISDAWPLQSLWTVLNSINKIFERNFVQNIEIFQDTSILQWLKDKSLKCQTYCEKKYYTRRLLLPCLIHKRSCFWPTSSSLAASCRIVDSHKGFKKSARGLDYIWTGGRRRVLADILRRGVSSRRWGQTFLRICAVKWVKDKQPQSRHTKSKMCRQNLKKLHWKKKRDPKEKLHLFLYRGSNYFKTKKNTGNL